MIVSRAFLSIARRPKFNFIAPGISLPDPEAFGSDNVLPSITNESYPKTIPPIHILDAKGYVNSADTTPPFGPPGDKLSPVPCGLYIPNTELTSDTIEEASARLVLPFIL